MLPDGDFDPQWYLDDLTVLLRSLHDQYHQMTPETRELAKRAVYVRYIDCLDRHRKKEADDLVLAWRVR